MMSNDITKKYPTFDSASSGGPQYFMGDNRSIKGNIWGYKRMKILKQIVCNFNTGVDGLCPWQQTHLWEVHFL